MTRFRGPFRAILVAIWAMLILWLSLDPSPPVPENDMLAWDKAQHAAAYGLLTLLVGLARNSGATGNLGRWLGAAVTAVAYGALLELLQAFCTVNRAAEWGDLLADATGALLVVAVMTSISRIRSCRENVR